MQINEATKILDTILDDMANHENEEMRVAGTVIYNCIKIILNEVHEQLKEIRQEMEEHARNKTH